MSKQSNGPMILITDAVDDYLLKGLELEGYKVDYMPNIERAAVLEIIQHYIGVIVNTKVFVDDDFIDKAKKLRFIGRLGSGLEIIDLNYCAEHQIEVIRTPDGNNDAVAEHVLAMLLSLNRNLIRSNSQVRSMIWNREQNRGIELMRKKIAVLGFGYTGSALVKKLSGFSVQVLVYDKYLKNYCDQIDYAFESDLEQIFEEADILSIHLPATEETRAMVNFDFLNRFKKNIILVNTSRGNIIPTDDLVKALKTGKVKAACLDVFENEKPFSHSLEERDLYNQLFNFEQVILSPHIAGWTLESKQKIAQLMLDRIMAL